MQSNLLEQSRQGRVCSKTFGFPTIMSKDVR